MFGQPATSPFASPAGTAGGAATPFGAPAPTTGFGAAAPAPTSAFGSPAPAPGGFGGFGSPPAAAAPAAGGFGGFGAAPAPAAPTTGFGGFGSPAPAPTSAFGAPAATTGATTPFGAPAAAPSGGLFGAAPAPAPSGGLFGGGAAAAPGGFGAAPTPAPGGFGGFGSTGATTGGFGSTANTTPPAFGAAPAAPSGGLFGAAPAPAFGGTPAPAPGFGAPAPAPGLFGAAPAPAATGGGLFGSPAAAGTGKPGTAAVPYQVTSKNDGTAVINIQSITAMPAYESKSMEELRLEDYMAGNKGTMGQNPAAAAAPAAGGFGGFGAAPAPAPGAFGAAPAPAPGLFGAAPTPAPGAFGAAPAPAAGGFGAPAAPAFGAAPAPAPGGFGAAPAPAAGGFGGFGSAPAPAAGGFGGFGGAAAAPKPAGGLFGAAPAAPAPAPGGLFGAAPAPAPGGGLFGAPAPAAPAPGGLFGASPAPAPAGGLFGAPAPAAPPATGGLFGAPAPAPAAGGLFGAPAPAPAAGGLFGAPAPAAGGLFGAPAPKPAGGLFGAPAAPAAGGLFGSPAPAPAAGGLFGSTPSPAAGGLFGAPAPAAPAGGLFGAPAPAAGSLFGSPPPAPAAAMIAPPPTADALLAQQLAAVENQKKELAMLDAWRGQPSSGSSVIPSSLSERDASAYGSGGYGVSGGVENGGIGAGGRASSYAASSGLFLPYQAAPRSAARIRPRGFAPVKSLPGAGAIGKAGVGGASPLVSPDAYLGSSAKRLVIKPGSLTPKPKMRLLLTNGGDSNDKQDGDNVGPIAGGEETTPNGIINRGSLGVDASSPATTVQGGTEDRRDPPIGVNTPPAGFTSPEASATARVEVVEASPSPGASSAASPAEAAVNGGTPQSSRKASPASSGKADKAGLSYDFYRQVVGSPEENGTPAAKSPLHMNGPEKQQQPSDFPSYVPKLTKAGGYEVSPSLEAMRDMSEADLAAVSNFTVSREGYGSVAWEGAVDVRGVDLDSVITIESRDVAVYDSEEEEGTKPPVGSKLNRPAIITMQGIYPKDGPGASAEAKAKFEKKIAKTTTKMGADLISFNSTDGIWTFRVAHFSRYALDDDDDSDDEEPCAGAPMDGDSGNTSEPYHDDPASKASPLAPATQDFEERGRGGRPRAQVASAGKSRFVYDEEMSDPTDGEESSVGLTSEGEGSSGGDKNDAQAILQAADDAYAIMASSDPMEPVTGADQAMEEVDEGLDGRKASHFVDEGETSSTYVLPKPFKVCDLPPLQGPGMCARIAKKCGVKSITSSSTDFGLRMGRSFRVGWRPDGSFVLPSQLNVSPSQKHLVQRRPVVCHDKSPSLPLLETHLKNSTKHDIGADQCPQYTLPSPVGSAGDSMSSYKALCAAFDDYTEAAKVHNTASADPESIKVVSRAFFLLATLYGQEDDAFGSMGREGISAMDSLLPNERRMEGLKIWLREAVAHDVVEGIDSAKERNDCLLAIFHALSGGDMAKACSIAIDHGHLRLATLLSSNDLQSRTDMQRQVTLLGSTSNIPPTLTRIYTLLGGDQGVEEDLYKNAGSVSGASLDWRRRLALRLWFSTENEAFPSVLGQYQKDVADGVAPPPHPRYVTNSVLMRQPETRAANCILYLLLQMWVEGSNASGRSEMSLSAIISPTTHTSSIHDFSMAYHLAATLSALGCCGPLTTINEARLVDSYVMQLINSGHWEWAVYVCICSCTGAGGRSDMRELWRNRALDIVLQNYTEGASDGSMEERRLFLQEEVGVPSSWFDMALADRCISLGDAWKYVGFAVRFSPDEAMEAHEELILPSILFRGDDDAARKLIEFMESLGGDGSQCESSVMYQFLKLSEEVLQLSQQQSQDDRGRQSRRIGELQILASELQRKLEEDEASCELIEHKYAHFGKLAKGKNVPRSVCIAEASAYIALLRWQLSALRGGFSIFEDGGLYGTSEMRRLKLASQLAYLASKRTEEDDFAYSLVPLGSRDSIRGRYGVM